MWYICFFICVNTTCKDYIQVIGISITSHIIISLCWEQSKSSLLFWSIQLIVVNHSYSAVHRTVKLFCPQNCLISVVSNKVHIIKALNIFRKTLASCGLLSDYFPAQADSTSHLLTTCAKYPSCLCPLMWVPAGCGPPSLPDVSSCRVRPALPPSFSIRFCFHHGQCAKESHAPSLRTAPLALAFPGKTLFNCMKLLNFTDVYARIHTLGNVFTFYIVQSSMWQKHRPLAPCDLCHFQVASLLCHPHLVLFYSQDTKLQGSPWYKQML